MFGYQVEGTEVCGGDLSANVIQNGGFFRCTERRDVVLYENKTFVEIG